MMKPILIVDNYDSFVYNLIQLLEEAGASNYEIVFNNEIPFNRLNKFFGLILSPGPGLPKDVPMMNQLLRETYDKIPILGICLGHQIIAEFFGAKIQRCIHPMHGQKSVLKIDELNSCLFQDLYLKKWVVGRYHSWLVTDIFFPTCLKITARSERNEIMALEHKKMPIFGTQFHPESYLSNCGQTIIKNWLQKIDNV